MMDGSRGTALTTEAIQEAVGFRQIEEWGSPAEIVTAYLDIEGITRPESADIHLSFRILDKPIKHGFRYFFRLLNLYESLIDRTEDRL
ncbi:MAG TPA: hypothetical protein VG168_16755 [Bryobacteraceae bacterium]|jgi:hypothetical protein|nr:hypothetical protein [Bryobacteraceae bacterium]